jgi:hypothetical protein
MTRVRGSRSGRLGTVPLERSQSFVLPKTGDPPFTRERFSDSERLESRQAAVASLTAELEKMRGELGQKAAARAAEAADLRRRLSERDARVSALEGWCRQYAHRLSLLTAEREALLSSTSWRLTLPLRWLVTRTRAWRGSVRRRSSDLRSRLVRLTLGRWRRDGPVAGEGPEAPKRYAVCELHPSLPDTLVPRVKTPVLCVTHVPPWPRRAGNEYRIGRMLDWMVARGHPTIVVVAPLGGEHAPSEHDTREMVRRYGNVVVSLPDGRVDARFTTLGLSLARLEGRPFCADGGKPGNASPPMAHALSELETYFCHDALVGVVLALERSAAPCLLYVNYIFMTRFLPFTSARSSSFVDTIDVFSTKREKVGRFGIEDPLCLSPDEEARCLRRADAVVAIQPEEAAVLARLVPDRTVLTAGVDFDCDVSAASSESPVVVCVASDNALNVRGLRDFLRFAWPLVRREVPDATLVLAGKAAGAVPLDDAGAGIEARGVVEDVAPLYREARVAINPAVAGTGLKIKTIEALRHFRPIVVWPRGVDGVIDEDLLKLCLVVGDWYEFAFRTVDALRNPAAPPDAETQARIRRALAPDTVYRELRHWLDHTPAAMGSGTSEP